MSAVSPPPNNLPGIGLTRQLAALAGALAAASDVTVAAGLLCRSADSLIGDGRGAAVIRVADPDAGRVVAAHLLDAHAVQDGLGGRAEPAADPVRTTVLGDGLRPDVLAAMARRVGCGHALAISVATQDDPQLWLVVLRDTPVDQEVLERADVLASHGALGMHAAHLAQARTNLQTALTTNRHIATAVGIIMATGRVSSQDAFDVLRQASQNTHRKLADVASDVVFTGAVPDTRAR